MERLKRVFSYITLSAVNGGYMFAANSLLSLAGVYMVQQLRLPVAFQTLICVGIFPLNAVILLPIMGFLSDKFPIKRFKRRFFVFTGSIMLSILLVLIGFSEQLGYLFGDEKRVETSSESVQSSDSVQQEPLHTYGVILCTTFMIIASVFVSFVLGLGITLMQELVPYEHQKSVNTVYSIAVSIALISFYLLSSLLAQTTYYYPIMFVLTAIVLTTTCLITCATADERKAIYSDQQVGETTHLMKEETSSDEINNDSIENDDNKDGVMEREDDNNGVDVITNSQMVDTPNDETAKQGKGIIGFIKSQFSVDFLLVVFLGVTMTIPANICVANMSVFFAENLFRYEPDDPDYSKAVSYGMFNVCVMYLFESIFAFALSPLMKRFTNTFCIVSFVLCSIGFISFILFDYFAQDHPGNTYIIIASYVAVTFFSMAVYSYTTVPFVILKNISLSHQFAFRTGFLISANNGFYSLTGYVISGLLYLFDSLVVLYYVGLVFCIIVLITSPFILYKTNRSDKHDEVK